MPGDECCRGVKLSRWGKEETGKGQVVRSFPLRELKVYPRIKKKIERGSQACMVALIRYLSGLYVNCAQVHDVWKNILGVVVITYHLCIVTVTKNVLTE